MLVCKFKFTNLQIIFFILTNNQSELHGQLMDQSTILPRKENSMC